MQIFSPEFLMKGFILAAGFGERLRPLTERIPKPLVPVNGIPAIVYSIAFLKSCGIDQVICNLHYRANDVMEFFDTQDNFGIRVNFSVEKEILGTGGGIRNCKDFLHEDFILVNSDIVADINPAEVINHFYSSGNKSCVVVKPVLSGASVSIDGENVVDFRNFLESGIEPTHEYTGIAVINSEIMKYLEPDFSSVVYTGFTSLIKRKRLISHEHRGLWQDIGTAESLETASERLENERGFMRRVIDVSGYKREM